MKENEKAFEDIENIGEQDFDLDSLEKQLDSDVEEQLLELGDLEEDFKKIGNPETLGNTVMDVVWEQFLNQVGVEAGEDFIKENRGLTLDLRDSAHIQTTENFEKGNIASHNYMSKDNLAHNYDRYKSTPHKVFRDEYVNPGMDKTLQRAGQLNNQGVETVKDIYTGRQIPTATKLENGRNNPKAAQREHVNPSEKLYKNSTLQMSYDDQDLADVINNPENLQGYTTAERNNRKSNHSADEMEEYDKNKHWEKANKRADEFIKKKEDEGKERLIKKGKQTQKEEAFRIGGTALRAALMGLLAELMRNTIQKLISWFKSSQRKMSTLIDSIKEAIHIFTGNLKRNLLSAGNTMLTSIATALFSPIIGMLKKAWIFLKQGWKALKQAFNYIKDPKNKGKSFSILMLEVGKIIIAGLTAGGAILLGEIIEKGLLTIPVFAIQIPLLGSLASIIGIFLGAVISGIIGVIALNLIDKAIANKQRKLNIAQRISKTNEILQMQVLQKTVSVERMKEIKVECNNGIAERHTQAREHLNKLAGSLADTIQENDKCKQRIDDVQETIEDRHDESKAQQHRNEALHNQNQDALKDLFKNLED